MASLAPPTTPHCPPKGGGGERDRTDGLLLAKQALSQLSYTPACRNGPVSRFARMAWVCGSTPPNATLRCTLQHFIPRSDASLHVAPSFPSFRNRHLVGLDGFEPSTPALSRRCSNQLSYRPSLDTRTDPPLLAEQPIGVSTRPTQRALLLYRCERLTQPIFRSTAAPLA
jgi:hypothetical protein